MSAPVCTIAVIVPVHNAAKYLPDCLDAIAAQQFDDFCCVLVDDGCCATIWPPGMRGLPLSTSPSAG